MSNLKDALQILKELRKEYWDNGTGIITDYYITMDDIERLDDAIDILENQSVKKSASVSPRLFYVVAESQHEEGYLEQITNGLTYEKAVAYRDGKFCKNRWPNAYILASLNEN